MIFANASLGCAESAVGLGGGWGFVVAAVVVDDDAVDDVVVDADGARTNGWNSSSFGSGRNADATSA